MDEELKKEDLINHLKGKIELKRYEIEGFIGKYITIGDRYSIIRKIAINVASGSHIYDEVYWAGIVEPDLPDEVKNQQVLEVMIHAAALTLIEGIKGPHHKKPLTKKDIIEHYADGITCKFHVDYFEAQKLLKDGIKYHKRIYEALKKN